VTRIGNLARFAAQSAALVWGLAFNGAAYVAWVVYVILPSSRVTGAAPMNWTADALARDPHWHPTGLVALLVGVAQAPWAPTVAALAVVPLLIVLYRIGAFRAQED
jgi:hypothetical protein